MKKSTIASGYNRMAKWQYALLLLMLLTFSLYSLPSFFGERPALGIHNSALWRAEQQQLLTNAGILPQQIIASNDQVLLVFDAQDAQQKARSVLEQSGLPANQLTLEYHSRAPEWLKTLGGAPVKLGLDLRGGSQLLIGVDTRFLVDSKVGAMMEELREQFRQAKLRGVVIQKGQAGTLSVSVANDEMVPALQSLLRGYATGQPAAWRLARSDGQFTLTLTEQERNTLINQGVVQNLSILKKRINELGITEASVQRQGQDAIRIELPGVHNPKQAKQVIGATASLAFYQLDASSGQQVKDRQGRVVSLARQPVLKGDHIVDARAGADEMGKPQVSITLDRSGGNKMAQFSRNHLGEAMATRFTDYRTAANSTENSAEDGSLRAYSEVINVATIQSVLGNQFRITGLDSLSEAQDLAMLLRAGALTAPLQILEERSIGPTLGKQNIEAGFTALAAGMLGMMLFMVLWYRRFGWVAVTGLVANLLMQVGMLALLPGAVLTLPGIAGLVLTVGMAVDTNVLIFERIRDRLREGGSLANAIDFGYRSAFGTILDANITTLICAVVLYAIGSGPLQGFSITLILGLISSMITGIWGTRAIINPIWGRTTQRMLRI